MRRSFEAPKQMSLDLHYGSPVSRRDLLAGGAATIACAFVPAASLRFARTSASKEVLTSRERQSLEAIVSRMIPSDSDGPGALEAGCARYIESALGDAYRSLRNAYSLGLAALDSHAMASGRKSFSALGETEQDKILSDCERNVKIGEFGDSAAFFEMVRRHVLEGMFGDPSYGGNAHFAGWDLIGYPGPRMYVPPQMQAMDAKTPPSRVSPKQLVHGSR
jgi:Gluconate 2-dehydrogenase subunit 3